MRKYTSSERVDVLPPQQQQAAKDALQQMGKTSARDLDDAQRQRFVDALRVK